ncbi:ThuA domain-containing protein [Streptomyces beihaiensis]|uniref:ThuA domain-containing protein n=1 Tax=Streptomyces beihaiensis TaxID=2984495 RepID=A0ABT3TQK0_9ACTN|nr:ThuA domain-containing protein [Streptomyces beihaiensis]MCX3059314.1 ThuA domain-containing protein [Streptomyces beihaiensis]
MAQPTGTTPTVLVHTRTTDYRHASIPYAVDTLRALGFAVRHTEDPGEFARGLDPARGAPPAAVVFLSTSGDILTPEGRERLAAYIDGGGGFAGVHAAACTEYGWPYYGTLLAARFARHPAHQPGRLRVADHDHPATRHLGESWEFEDEWYDFRSDPRSDPAVRVLAYAEEASYEGAAMGGDHPLVWCRAQGTGRVFYTGLGHSEAAWSDPDFRVHVAGGVGWAGRFASPG